MSTENFNSTINAVFSFPPDKPMGRPDKPMGRPDKQMEHTDKLMGRQSFFKLRTSQNRFRHVTTGQEKSGKNLSGEVKKRWVMVIKVNHA